MPNPIYLDYNASTPLDSEVRSAMQSFFDSEFGNPSSSHSFGEAPRAAVREARNQVARILNCTPEEIIFTSGGTESNNHAIIGAAFHLKDKGNHIITTQIEHPAVLQVCRYLESFGFVITRLPVNDLGIVNVDELYEAITSETILITVMHANNEVGSIQPITEISDMAKRKNVIFHTDAAQTVGKISTDVQSLNVDMLSVAGHKIYAPKGVGALYVRKGVAIDNFMHGAGQECGRRAGTENVMGIAGLGKACEIALANWDFNITRMKKTRDDLFFGLKRGSSEIRRNGSPEKVLPNTLSVSFRNKAADRILDDIGAHVAASAGAACHSDLVKISHVLKAMKTPEDWAKGTIRFSTGKYTSDAEIQKTVKVVLAAVENYP